MPLAVQPTPRLVLGAVAVGVLGDLALRAGVGGLAGALTGAATVALLLRSQLVPRRQGRVLVLVGAVFAACLAIRSSGWLVPLNLLAALGLVGAGASLARSGSLFRLDPVAALRTTRRGVAHIAAAPGMLVDVADTVSGPSLRRWIPALRGAVLAVPVVIVLGAFLASADVVFADLLDLELSLANVNAHVYGTIAVTWLTAGLLRIAAAEPLPATTSVARHGGTVEACVVLGAVVLLFGAFVATQVVTAAGGADHVLETAGLTQAEYARSGFFQLLWVAALTIFGLVVLAGRVDLEGPSGRRVRRLAGAVVALALAIVTVAIIRLDLYRDAFGWTMLRLFSTAFAGWLGVVLALLGLALAGPKRLRGLGWFPTASAAAALGLLLALNVSNPAAMVARHNLARAGELELDTVVLDDLGDDAIPTIAAAIDELSARQRLEVQLALGCEAFSDGENEDENGDADDDESWAGWNLAESRAKRARAALCAT